MFLLTQERGNRDRSYLTQWTTGRRHVQMGSNFHVAMCGFDGVNRGRSGSVEDRQGGRRGSADVLGCDCQEYELERWGGVAAEGEKGKIGAGQVRFFC